MLLSPLVTLSLFSVSLAMVSIKNDESSSNTEDSVPANLPPHGLAGFISLTSGWKKIAMPSASAIVIPTAAIANNTYAPLGKQISGDFELSNLTFYGLDAHDNDGYPQDKVESKYNLDNRSVTRYYVYVGKRVESFIGDAKLKFGKNDTPKTCKVVGLARDVNVTTRNDKLNYMFFNFDYSVINEPFKAVRLNKFELYPHERRAPFGIYLDPVCSDLHQRYLEMFGTASEKCAPLQEAIRRHVETFVKDFTLKYLIEPHRIALEGAESNANETEEAGESSPSKPAPSESGSENESPTESPEGGKESILSTEPSINATSEGESLAANAIVA